MTSSKPSKKSKAAKKKTAKRPAKKKAPPPAKPPPKGALKKTCKPSLAAQQTILWMLEGIRARDIVEALQVEFPKCDPQKAIEAALDHFELTAAADTDTLRGWCLEAYRELYRRMVAIADFPAAARVVDKMMQYALRYPSVPAEEEKKEEEVVDSG